MKWIADILRPEPLHLIIESDAFRDITTQESIEGFYVYVFKKNGENFDYLQDSFEQAKSFALRKFNVPLDAWKQVEE